jgi:hypothetical protein
MSAYGWAVVVKCSGKFCVLGVGALVSRRTELVKTRVPYTSCRVMRVSITYN